MNLSFEQFSVKKATPMSMAARQDSLTIETSFFIFGSFTNKYCKLIIIGEYPKFKRTSQNKKSSPNGCFSTLRAENETRTRDPDLGKVVLYQLSYFRKISLRFCADVGGASEK